MAAAHHHHARRDTLSGPFPVARLSEDHTDLAWPFGRLEGLSPDDVRETAYEIFFTACRSSPGFGGGRNPLSFYPSSESPSPARSSGAGGGVVVTTPTSRVKRALGLKMVKRSPSRRMGGGGSSPSSGAGMTLSPQGARPRRPMTSAEIMRQQMRVSEQSDNRLRKALMRTLVGQMGRRADTIILPLELLRHLRASDFNDTREYQSWQRRQLRVLELGLVVHPSLPLDPSADPFAARLRSVLRSADPRSPDAMRSLCNSAVSLSWRGGENCRWADGSPLNAHLYASLLGAAVFDPRDDTLVLDEVDELLELIAKTWPTLGIDRHAHAVCFAWVLFRQYVATAMVEPDLLCAAHSVLAAEAGGGGGEMFRAVTGSVREWAEKRLTRYHEYFLRGTVGQIETLLPLALLEPGGEDSGDRVQHFIRSSVTHAFHKLGENGITGNEEVRSSAMLKLAKETEELVCREKKCFSPILNTWHSSAAAVAAATLHGCFGSVLRRYLRSVVALSADAVEVLQTAARLEKTLVHVVVEDSVECPDGGKSVVREMLPFDVESFVSNLLKTWVGMRMERGRECIQRAKDNENWNPKSKADPYGQSGIELLRIAEETVKELFEIPMGMSEGLVEDVASGLDTLFQDYAAFVASCAPKQSYIPALPTLTRCSKDSKLTKLWKKATPCGVNHDEPYHFSTVDPRQSTSRATQRLYIRLNTLHLILSRLNSIHKTLTLTLTQSGSFLDPARTSARSAAHHVAQSAAYRLIFLDSAPVFSDSLYSDSVHDSRIRPALRALKQNLTLMCNLVLDHAALSSAAREILRATLEAFLTVLLAGGPTRAFDRADHVPVQEDFEALKRAFEGLVPEGVLEREAEAAAGVIALMARPTDELVEEFSVATCEASGAAGVVVAASQRLLPMPPTTGRWSSSDANTILRVLCHRDDRLANQFLKRTFQLPKRR